MKRGQKHQRRITNRRESLRRQARYLEAKLAVQMHVTATTTPVSITVDSEPKPTYRRPTLAKLTRRESKILKRVAQGWHIGVGRGLHLCKSARIGAKLRISDVLSLVKQGLLNTALLLTETARSLLWAVRQNAMATGTSRQVMLVERNANALQTKSALLRAAARL